MYGGSGGGREGGGSEGERERESGRWREREFTMFHRHKQVESSLAGGSMAFSQDASLRAVPQTLREWDRARSSLSPVREESPSSPSQQ